MPPTADKQGKDGRCLHIGSLVPYPQLYLQGVTMNPMTVCAHVSLQDGFANSQIPNQKGNNPFPLMYKKL